jgi:hypothetical protein
MADLAARGGRRGERERRRVAAVGMQKEPSLPRNAARAGGERKLQNRMGQPLEALQCVLILHFADEERVRVTAGDSLRTPSPSFLVDNIPCCF